MTVDWKTVESNNRLEILRTMHGRIASGDKLLKQVYILVFKNYRSNLQLAMVFSHGGKK